MNSWFFTKSVITWVAIAADCLVVVVALVEVSLTLFGIVMTEIINCNSNNGKEVGPTANPTTKAIRS